MVTLVLSNDRQEMYELMKDEVDILVVTWYIAAQEHASQQYVNLHRPHR